MNHPDKAEVILHPVTISLLGEALSALEAERSTLYAQARRISQEQQEILRVASASVERLSNDHRSILTKMSAIDDSIQALLGRMK